jgi:hypothetical protein
MAVKNNKSQYDHLYLSADEYFVINAKDSRRNPIYISLPKPPPIELIDGYGEHPDNQVFHNKKTPPKLKQLEDKILKNLQDRKKDNYQETITGYKVLDMFWEELETYPERYEDEIEFIKNVWYWRRNGYWFFNDGKPTYITGRHFMFLNYFYMPDVSDNAGYPEYRDRHRREFLFRDYLRVAHHTFAKRDEKGWAVAEEDGSYEMIDMKIRLFFGVAHAKSRRNGSSIMSMSNLIEGAENGFAKRSTIVSKDGKFTEELYTNNLLPAWSARPFYIRPVWDGNFRPTNIRYFPPRNNTGFETLMGTIDFTESAGLFKKDGTKLSGDVMVDEPGKTENVDVLQRHDVYKNAASLGDGTSIIGFFDYISTVEDINAAGQAFLDILDLSDFYQRGNNGQTSSGLVDMIFPSYDGLEGFIDKFGQSVINEPTERQLAMRPKSSFAVLKQGAFQYQQEKRDDFLKNGTPKAMQSYREYVKKFPWDSSELSIGTSGDIGFDYEVIDKRIAELRKLNALNKLQIKVGNFYRVNNHPEGLVYWKTEEGGKFEMSFEPSPEQTNLKRRTMGYDVEQSKMIPQWEPTFKSRFICGCDHFEYSNQRADTGSSKQSDGGIAILRERDEAIDKADDPHEWHTRTFVLSYRYRPASALEYNEDVLMACEYYGCMVFMERNKTGTWEHFIRRGRGGYLRFEMDLQTGKLADKPGYYAQGESKNDLFAEVKDYITFRGYEENHLLFLEECRNIKSKDQLTKYDRLAAHGAALLGSRSPHGKVQDNFSNQKIDLSKCSWLSR